MNQQDMEVELKLIKERQSIQSHKLKDVDECCGKLQGKLDAESKIFTERLVKVENHMDTNCSHVEKKVNVLEERVNNNTKIVDEINSNLNKIRILIYAAIITSLAGLIWR